MIFPMPTDAWPKHPHVKTISSWIDSANGGVRTLVEIGTDLVVDPDQPGYDRAKAQALIDWVSQTIMGRGEIYQTTVMRLAAYGPIPCPAETC